MPGRACGRLRLPGGENGMQEIGGRDQGLVPGPSQDTHLVRSQGHRRLFLPKLCANNLLQPPLFAGQARPLRRRRAFQPPPRRLQAPPAAAPAPPRDRALRSRRLTAR